METDIKIGLGSGGRGRREEGEGRREEAGGRRRREPYLCTPDQDSEKY
jgi:hypothetical protein